MTLSKHPLTFGRAVGEEYHIIIDEHHADDVVVIPTEKHGRNANRHSTSASPLKRNSAWADVRLSMLSNFSTAYNITNISLALYLMPTTVSASDTALCTSALIAGMIVGQIVGGTIGDVLGRHAAMTIVMSLQVVASLASALSFSICDRYHDDNGDDDDDGGDCFWNVYRVLAVWRFLLGVGCGGVYPLAATMSAECSDGVDQSKKSGGVRTVALSFSMQGVGYVTVPLMATLLVRMLGQSSPWAWRVLLALGAIPGLWLTILRVCKPRRANNKHSDHAATSTLSKVVEEDDEEEEDKQEQSRRHYGSMETVQTDCDEDSDTTGAGGNHNTNTNLTVALGGSADTNTTTNNNDAAPPQLSSHQTSSLETTIEMVLQAIRSEPDIVNKLMGTAVCWSLFDVCFYGQTLFQPVVLAAAFGSNDTSTIRDDLVVTSMALPGYFVSVAVLGALWSTPLYVQAQGFTMMAILYAIIAYYWDKGLPRVVMLPLYGATFFFSNFGPNTTTFLLPSMTYSPHCRSTLNGMCAACGKLGALVGAVLFEPTAQAWGNRAVMVICAGLSMVGMALTAFYVPYSLPYQEREEEELLRELSASRYRPVKSQRPPRSSLPSLLDHYD